MLSILFLSDLRRHDSELLKVHAAIMARVALLEVLLNLLHGNFYSGVSQDKEFVELIKRDIARVVSVNEHEHGAVLVLSIAGLVQPGGLAHLPELVNVKLAVLVGVKEIESGLELLNVRSSMGGVEGEIVELSERDVPRLILVDEEERAEVLVDLIASATGDGSCESDVLLEVYLTVSVEVVLPEKLPQLLHVERVDGDGEGELLEGKLPAVIEIGSPETLATPFDEVGSDDEVAGHCTLIFKGVGI